MRTDGSSLRITPDGPSAPDGPATTPRSAEMEPDELLEPGQARPFVTPPTRPQTDASRESLPSRGG